MYATLPLERRLVPLKSLNKGQAEKMPKAIRAKAGSSAAVVLAYWAGNVSFDPLIRSRALLGSQIFVIPTLCLPPSLFPSSHSFLLRPHNVVEAVSGAGIRAITGFWSSADR
jgi:hypothetical protein